MEMNSGDPQSTDPTGHPRPLDRQNETLSQFSASAAAMFEEMSPADTTTDPLLVEAIELVRKEGRASVSMLQRRMRIGYTRAARLVDMMEDRKIIGPPEGATQMRQVLDYGQTAPPKDDGA